MRGKKYPVIEDDLCRAAGLVRAQEFRSFYPEQAMAELGFIVVQDRRHGHVEPLEEVPRRLLEEPGRRRLARPHPLDQGGRREVSLAWTLTRVGIYGGSAGGQNAAGAVMTHGDFYKVAVADCGCHDNRMDKIWWNEQWMGWPVGPQYAANSNVTLARGLQGQAAADRRRDGHQRRSGVDDAGGQRLDQGRQGFRSLGRSRLQSRCRRRPLRPAAAARTTSSATCWASSRGAANPRR